MSDRLSLLLMVPGHQFSFQKLEEQVEDESQHGEDDDAGHEPFCNHEVAVVKDEGADALFGGDHFRRHQKEEGRAGSYAEAGEYHGKGVGQDHVFHGVAPAGVEAHGHLDEEGVHVFHAGVGVHGHGKKTPRAMMVTLDTSPIPSQRMKRGSRAIFGMG